MDGVVGRIVVIGGMDSYNIIKSGGDRVILEGMDGWGIVVGVIVVVEGKEVNHIIMPGRNKFMLELFCLEGSQWMEY